MQRLKESTRELHDTAEGKRLQTGLARGDIELPMYRAYLEQLYLVHNKLEELLRQHKKGDHVIGNAVNDEQMQENFLAHDLRALGGDPSKVKAVPATERLLRLMSEYSQRQPISLLGLH